MSDSLPQVVDRPVIVTLGRALGNTTKLKDSLDRIASFRPDSLLTRLTMLERMPSARKIQYYRDDTTALHRLLGQGLIHQERYDYHQQLAPFGVNDKFGNGRITSATLLTEPLPALALSGKRVDDGVYFAIQTICIYMTDTYHTVTGRLERSSPEGRLAFLRTYGGALELLAREGFIQEQRSLRFTNWLNTYGALVQGDGYWGERLAFLDSL